MGIWRPALILALVVYGVGGIMSSSLFSKPRRMSCEAYEYPDSTVNYDSPHTLSLFANRDWIELSNCQLATNAMFCEEPPAQGRAKHVLISVRPMYVAQLFGPKLVFIRRSLEADINLADDLRKLSSSETAPLPFSSLQRLKERRSQHIVRGMVSHDKGLMQGLRQRRALASESTVDGETGEQNLDVVIIEEDRTPSALPGFCALITGLALMTAMCVRASSSRKAPSISGTSSPLAKSHQSPSPK